MNEDYQQLVHYIKAYDFEMCLNCLFVISDCSQSFDSFLKTLLKEDALKEMELPYLNSYLCSKMEKK